MSIQVDIICFATLLKIENTTSKILNAINKTRKHGTNNQFFGDLQFQIVNDQKNKLQMTILRKIQNATGKILIAINDAEKR